MGAGNSGVIASARPTREPSGQPAGPARKVASGHTSASVVPRAEKTFGSWTDTDLMFASPACWLTATCRPAPAAFVVRPGVVAAISGENGSASQPDAPTGV